MLKTIIPYVTIYSSIEVACVTYDAENLTVQYCYSTTVDYGSHEDDRTILYKTKLLDGTNPNTNPKTNPNFNTNPNHKLTLIITLFSCFMLLSSTVP